MRSSARCHESGRAKLASGERRTSCQDCRRLNSLRAGGLQNAILSAGAPRTLGYTEAEVANHGTPHRCSASAVAKADIGIELGAARLARPEVILLNIDVRSAATARPSH